MKQVFSTKRPYASGDSSINSEKLKRCNSKIRPSVRAELKLPISKKLTDLGGSQIGEAKDFELDSGNIAGGNAGRAGCQVLERSPGKFKQDCDLLWMQELANGKDKGKLSRNNSGLIRHCSLNRGNYGKRSRTRDISVSQFDVTNEDETDLLCSNFPNTRTWKQIDISQNPSHDSGFSQPAYQLDMTRARKLKDSERKNGKNCSSGSFPTLDTLKQRGVTISRNFVQSKSIWSLASSSTFSEEQEEEYFRRKRVVRRTRSERNMMSKRRQSLCENPTTGPTNQDLVNDTNSWTAHLDRQAISEEILDRLGLNPTNLKHRPMVTSQVTHVTALSWKKSDGTARKRDSLYADFHAGRATTASDVLQRRAKSTNHVDDGRGRDGSYPPHALLRRLLHPFGERCDRQASGQITSSAIRARQGAHSCHFTPPTHHIRSNGKFIDILHP